MCTNPIRLKSGILVGCGHCLQCLKAYQDQWVARMSEEAKCWKPDGIILPIVFFTLKYRNDSIPCNYLWLHDAGYSVTDDSDVPSSCRILKEWTDTTHESRAEWETRHKYNLDLWRHMCTEVLSSEGMGSFLTHLPENYSSPILGLEFHSVRKSDVQNWLKRGRIMAERKKPEIFAQKVNPRFRSTWRDSYGSVHQLPSSAVPKNVKYFITSEYGPLTKRPHLHGVMFGITYNEFKKFFAEDWERNYGSVTFSAYDPSRGGMLYVAKYCAKGGYEHPYCSRDFFYGQSGREYHSKDYEYCISDFGVNVPLVDPTFHLISKGLGAGYCFNAELTQYFGVRLEEVVSESGRINFRVSDSNPDNIVMPSLPFSECFGKSRVLKIDEVSSGFRVRKYGYPSASALSSGASLGELIGESLIPYDAVVNVAVENNLLSKKYNRAYVKSKSKICHPAWHLIGHGVSQTQTSITSISLPRYYRRWLISPLASSLRTCAAYRLHPDIDAEITRALQCERPNYEAISILESFLDTQQVIRQDTAKRLRKCAQDYLCQSKL